jgi:lipopolysaccharide export system ATP-binding protein
VSLEVAAGEIVGLRGPNGAGKTTTFSIVVGLVEPDAGTVRLGDRDLTGLPMYRRARAGISYLPQEPSVFRKMTVEQNLLAILETLDLPHSAQRERADELLTEFGLEGVRDHRAYTLSGGERRRVEIARSLVV